MIHTSGKVFYMSKHTPQKSIIRDNVHDNTFMVLSHHTGGVVATKKCRH